MGEVNGDVDRGGVFSIRSEIICSTTDFERHDFEKGSREATIEKERHLIQKSTISKIFFGGGCGSSYLGGFWPR